MEEIQKEAEKEIESNTEFMQFGDSEISYSAVQSVAEKAYKTLYNPKNRFALRLSRKSKTRNEMAVKLDKIISDSHEGTIDNLLGDFATLKNGLKYLFTYYKNHNKYQKTRENLEELYITLSQKEYDALETNNDAWNYFITTFYEYVDGKRTTRDSGKSLQTSVGRIGKNHGFSEGGATGGSRWSDARSVRRSERNAGIEQGGEGKQGGIQGGNLRGDNSLQEENDSSVSKTDILGGEKQNTKTLSKSIEETNNEKAVYYMSKKSTGISGAEVRNGFERLKNPHAIKNKLERLGYEVEHNMSNVSNSEYLEVYNSETEEIFNIRFSDHALPLYYRQPDYEIGTHGESAPNAKNLLQAIHRQIGVATPPKKQKYIGLKRLKPEQIQNAIENLKDIYGIQFRHEKILNDLILLEDDNLELSEEYINSLGRKTRKFNQKGIEAIENIREDGLFGEFGNVIPFENLPRKMFDKQEKKVTQEAYYKVSDEINDIESQKNPQRAEKKKMTYGGETIPLHKSSNETILPEFEKKSSDFQKNSNGNYFYVKENGEIIEHKQQKGERRKDYEDKIFQTDEIFDISGLEHYLENLQDIQVGKIQEGIIGKNEYGNMIFTTGMFEKIFKKHGPFYLENLVATANNWDYVIENKGGMKGKINFLKKFSNGRGVLIGGNINSDGVFVVTHYEPNRSIEKELQNERNKEKGKQGIITERNENKKNYNSTGGNTGITSAEIQSISSKDIRNIQLQYNAEGQYLAPNGKPSLLPNKTLAKLVRTPQFKRWFGDWENNPTSASKMLDENGEPKIMRHGTRVKFEEFRMGTDNGYFGKGIYFTDSKTLSKQYGRVQLETFLNIRKPFVVKGNSWFDFLTEAQKLYPNITETNSMEVLKEHGYDGVMMKSWDDEVGMIVSIFDPHQVKHIKNRTFSDAKNIYNSTGGNTGITGAEHQNTGGKTDFKLSERTREIKKISRILEDFFNAYWCFLCIHNSRDFHFFHRVFLHCDDDVRANENRAQKSVTSSLWGFQSKKQQ